MALSGKTYTSILLAGVILICLVCLVQRWRTLAAEQAAPRIGLERSRMLYTPVDEDLDSIPAVEAGNPEKGNKVQQIEEADAAASGGKLDLNLAKQSQLEELPGIGPVLARRILEMRKRLGGFSSVDQLLEVEGIGENTLGELRPLLQIAD